jgi:mannose-6-phosphate isomerase-like protein (cupin superfamily)
MAKPVKWWKKRVERDDAETIFEVVEASAEAGFGFAVADIVLSQRHYHRRTIETYTLIAGELRVHLGDEVFLLRSPGQVLTIPTDTLHWAESAGSAPARIAVFSMPAWTPDDHLLLRHDPAELEHTRQLPG